MKVIQLSNLGEFIDRCQPTDAYYELNWDRPLQGPGDFNVRRKPGAVSKPKLVVLYVHGWHNNARPDRGDLVSFRQLMAGLAETNRDKQVTGIYVSWEANSDIPIWHYLDFWSKMGVADRIATSGTVTNVVAAIASMVAKSPEPGQFIAIGHSFGARILMASTLQSTIAATQRAHPGGANAYYREIEGLAQTTILLNPAFEAAYWTPVQAFNRREEHFSPDQKPVLLAISTDNDAATGYAFPIAQWLAWKTALGEITTLGNHPPFWTHELSSMAGSRCREIEGSPTLTESYGTANVCLNRAQGFEHNPFMLVHTNGSILDGHNGIWDRRFSTWLFGYLDQLGKQLPPKVRQSQDPAIEVRP